MNKKYYFFPNESKIYDFLQFPKLIYVSEEDFNVHRNYIEVIDDDFKGFLYNIKDTLMPYKDEIQEFYMKELSIIDKISSLHHLYNKKNVEEYLDYLLSLTELDINTSITYSLLSQESHDEAEQQLLETAKEMVQNKDNLLNYIKTTSFDGNVKWNLFCFVEEPIKYLRKYVQLMHKLELIFENIYTMYEAKINDYGKSLVKELNIGSSKGLSELTYNLVGDDIVNSDEINFFVSLIRGYDIGIYATIENPYIAWGLFMSDAFEKIKILNENKLNERVLVFKNLGDKTRYEVLKLISRGITSTKEIAGMLNVSSATISYHISNLTTSKIIKLDRINTNYKYIVNYEYLNKCVEELKKDIY